MGLKMIAADTSYGALFLREAARQKTLQLYKTTEIKLLYSRAFLTFFLSTLLYAYKFLKCKFQKSHEVAYHYSTFGNELDFLVNAGDVKMVVDAKYKPLYIYGKDHQYMRQVSGYSRLEVVYNKLKVEEQPY